MSFRQSTPTATIAAILRECRGPTRSTTKAAAPDSTKKTSRVRNTIPFTPALSIAGRCRLSAPEDCMFSQRKVIEKLEAVSKREAEINKRVWIPEYHSLSEIDSFNSHFVEKGKKAERE